MKASTGAACARCTGSWPHRRWSTTVEPRITGALIAHCPSLRNKVMLSYRNRCQRLQRSGNLALVKNAMVAEPTVAVFSTHIAPALGYGGVATTVAVLTRAWARTGRPIVVCASDESMGGRLRPEEVQLGESVHVDLYHCYWFRRWGFGLGAIPRIFFLCRKTRIIYVHGIATWPNTLAALFCCLLRRRFAIAPRGGLMSEHVALIRAKKPHKWLFYKLLTLPTLRRAAAIHCTSNTEAHGVRALLGDRANIFIIPNGIDCKSIPIAAEPKGHGLTLCFLGHIQQEKGINAFIRAWLSCQRPLDRLVVAGRSTDREYFAEFQRLAEQSSGTVTYKGYLDRAGVMDVLGDSHFLVLPSGLEEAGGMRENFGNVVAEAMAAGRPVLVTKGLAWDHVETLGAGRLFERNEESVRAVLRWTQAMDRPTWQRMARAARHYVEHDLDAERLGERVWEVLTNKALDARWRAES